MQNAEGRMKELRQPLLGSLSSLQVDAIALVNRHPDSAFCLLPSAFARRGLTLIELMISIMILSFTVAAWE